MSHTHTQPTTADVLLDERQAAAILNYTQRCLQAWRRSGRGPKFVKVSSRSIRYRRVDLDQWIQDRIRTSTSDTGTAL